MFERFSADARAVVVGAQSHARRLGHPRVGTEHLLLALLDSSGPTASLLADAGLDRERVEASIEACTGRSPLEQDRAALAGLGIDIDHVRQSVEARFGPGALTDDPGRRRRRFRRLRRDRHRPPTGHIPFSRRAKKVLELALREALRLQHRRIDAEHVALGLLREGQGLASAVLDHRGVDLSALRRSIEASMRRAA